MKKIRAGGKFGNGKIYTYPDKVGECHIIDKQIKDDFNKFCKEFKINKSKLLEKFYKTILTRYHDGTLNVSRGYVTINISD